MVGLHITRDTISLTHEEVTANETPVILEGKAQARLTVRHRDGTEINANLSEDTNSGNRNRGATYE